MSENNFENVEPKNKSENFFEFKKQADLSENLSDSVSIDDLSDKESNEEVLKGFLEESKSENAFDFSGVARFFDAFFKSLETKNSSGKSQVELIPDNLSNQSETDEIEDEQIPNLRRAR